MPQFHIGHTPPLTRQSTIYSPSEVRRGGPAFCPSSAALCQVWLLVPAAHPPPPPRA